MSSLFPSAVTAGWWSSCYCLCRGGGDLSGENATPFWRSSHVIWDKRHLWELELFFFFFLATTTSKPVITSLLNFWLNPEQNGKGLYFLQGLFVNVTASFEALWKGCLYFVFVFLKSPLFVPPPPRSHTTAGHQANCLNGCLHTHKQQRTPEADYSNGFS